MTSQFNNQSQEIKTLIYKAWKAASNAYHLYPEKKHNWADYWNEDREKELSNSIASLLQPNISVQMLKKYEQAIENFKSPQDKYADDTKQRPEKNDQDYKP